MNQLKKIKLLLLDVDGILTNGKKNIFSKWKNYWQRIL